MVIECPTCSHQIRLVDLRPGRFTPRCPKCLARFQLIVPETEGALPEISTVAPRRPGRAVRRKGPDHEPTETAALGPNFEYEKHGSVSVEAEPVVEVEPIQLASKPLFLDRFGRLPRGVPRLLGGHLMLKLLGQGPRGRAFLALPLTLERDSVLKVVASDRAGDPVFRAWYTREAFAAAQLDSPHLVSVRGLGSDRGWDYCALEFVAGPSLAERLRGKGRMEPREAAVAILQAARGMRFAHSQGLLHRDLKPENLRLDPSGVIKVDDLGLEMTPSLAAAMQSREKAGNARTGAVTPGPTQMTLHAAVGTPSYMAPEQAQDPITSDGRADVYSLGCTFYELVTGRPPFSGTNAVDLIAAHREATPVQPAEFVPGLPRSLQDIIRVMMGKHPVERYPNMAVLVEVLEDYLGVGGDAEASAGEALVHHVREATDRLRGSSVCRLRTRVLIVAGAVWLGFAAILFWLRLTGPGLGILGFGCLTAVLLFADTGLNRHTERFRLARAVIMGGGLGGPLLIPTSTLLLILLAYATGWLGTFVFLSICATALAGAFHVFVDRPALADRDAAIEPVRAEVVRLGRAGHDEEWLQALVATEAGGFRDELSGQIFGVRATTARPGCGDTSRAVRGSPLPSASIPAPGRLFEKILEARRARAFRRHLQRVEEGRLEAEGLNLLTARRRGHRIAKAMVMAAAGWHDERRILAINGDPGFPGGSPLMDRLRHAIEAPEAVLEPHETTPGRLSRRVRSISAGLVGRKIRFLLGSALLGLFVYWLDARGILTADRVRGASDEVIRVGRLAVERRDPTALREAHLDLAIDRKRLDEPLAFAWLPEDVRSIHGANLGTAAALLLVSLISRRSLAGLLTLAGAAVTLWFPIRGISIFALADRWDAHAQARILSVGLLMLGLLLRRRARRDHDGG